MFSSSADSWTNPCQPVLLGLRSLRGEGVSSVSHYLQRTTNVISVLSYCSLEVCFVTVCGASYVLRVLFANQSPN